MQFHFADSVHVPSTNAKVPANINATSMVALTSLPSELLRLMLSALADIDLRYLFVSRQACKTFQAVITDMLTKTPSSLGLSIHAFLLLQFFPVLDSLSADPDLQPGYMEGHAPYNALPWALNPSTREIWIREEVS
jgi:hypothetical protein